MNFNIRSANVNFSAIHEIKMLHCQFDLLKKAQASLARTFLWQATSREAEYKIWNRDIKLNIRLKWLTARMANLRLRRYITN
jgi:hypothetical protein